MVVGLGSEMLGFFPHFHEKMQFAEKDENKNRDSICALVQLGANAKSVGLRFRCPACASLGESAVALIETSG